MTLPLRNTWLSRYDLSANQQIRQRRGLMKPRVQDWTCTQRAAEASTDHTDTESSLTRSESDPRSQQSSSPILRLLRRLPRRMFGAGLDPDQPRRHLSTFTCWALTFCTRLAVQHAVSVTLNLMSTCFCSHTLLIWGSSLYVGLLLFVIVPANRSLTRWSYTQTLTLVQFDASQYRWLEYKSVYESWEFIPCLRAELWFMDWW